MERESEREMNWCVQPTASKVPNSANSQVNLEVGLPPVEPQDDYSPPEPWLAARGGPEPGHPTETETLNTCCYKLLSFGVICYTAVTK